MNSNDAARAFARALRSRAGLVDCQVYAHDILVLPSGQETVVDPEQGIVLPALFVRVKCQALNGSSTIGKARVEIDVESQVDDSTAAQHAAREAEIRAALADQPSLLLAFQVIATVALLGKPCLVDNDPETEHRAFKTPFTYHAGVKAIDFFDPPPPAPNPVLGTPQGEVLDFGGGIAVQA